MRNNLRRALVGFAAGLFQGPAFLWGQFAPLVGASTGETAWVRWSPLGLTLALVFGLVVLAGDRVGARPLILTVCAATLAGAVLLAVGGVGAGHAHVFAFVAVAGSFVQFAATRAGVLVSAHETRGLQADQQLTRSRGLRRWFVIGIYAPSLAAGMLAARYGWVIVYCALSGVYVLALAVLWRGLRTDRTERPPRVPLARAVRAGASDPLLILAAIAALFAQAVVFGTVQGLPAVLHAHHLSTSKVGYLQGSAILAALLVARPRKLKHTTFGRLVPLVALTGAATSAALVAASHSAQARALLVLIAGGGAIAFITIELLKQWSQSIAQVQARTDRPDRDPHDYVRQALWLLLANVGAIIGALWIAKLAAPNPHQWVAAISTTATLFLATTLAWYETHHQIRHRHARHRRGARDIPNRHRHPSA
jgi:hypothetical protein